VSDRQAQADKFKKDYEVRVRCLDGGTRTFPLKTYSIISAVNHVSALHLSKGEKIISAVEME